MGILFAIIKTLDNKFLNLIFFVACKFFLFIMHFQIKLLESIIFTMWLLFWYWCDIDFIGSPMIFNNICVYVYANNV